MHTSINGKEKYLMKSVSRVSKPRTNNKVKEDETSKVGPRDYPKLVKISLDLTYRCRRKCMYCMQKGLLKAIYGNAEQAKRKEMSTDDIKNLFVHASQMGVEWINMVGGEPFLREDILILVDHAASLGLKTGIPTKYILSEKELKELKEAGLNRIGIGLDTPLSSLADHLVGESGYFHKCTCSIRAAKKVGLEVILMPVISKLTIDQFPKLLKLAEELGVDNVHPQIYEKDPLLSVRYDSQEPEKTEELKLDDPLSAQKWINEQTPPIFKKKELKKGKQSKYPTFCSIGQGTISVRSDGKVYFCPHLMDYVVGDVKSKPLKEIWYKGKIRDILFPKRDLFQGTICNGCKLFEKCSSLGRCSLRCFMKYGRVFAPDFAICFHRHYNPLRSSDRQFEMRRG